MNCITLEGSCYEMGLRQGTALLERGERVLEQVPFPITPERVEFAEACLPVYVRWFPGALEELEGIAAGQACDFRLLAGAVLPMYCMVPQPCCSCFAVRSGGQALLGRNSDFLTVCERNNTHCAYHPAGGRRLLGNTTAFVELEDGVNSAGLAIGLTSVWPGPPRPGLNAGMLLRLALESCGSVGEALALLERVPTASSHTLVLADRTGELALVESRGGLCAVRRPVGEEAWVCAVNSYHLPELAEYRCPGGDDWQAEERYATMADALSAGVRTAEEAMDLLRGGRGFLCQYDRRSGHDTVWSVLCDLTAGEVWLAGGNPSRTSFEKLTRRGEGGRFWDF